MQKKDRKKKSRFGTLLIVLGVLLIIGAAALVIFNKWQSMVAERESGALAPGGVYTRGKCGGG